MKVEAECASCLLARATAETYYATTNPALRFRVIKEVIKLLNREFRPSTVPADIGTKRDRLIKKLTGNDDPYKISKKMSNEKAVKLFPYAKKIVEKGYTQQERF
ncbi:MAG: ARMT1-like domain-containing protein, partial [Candidatus Bathyarchaeia archaeon]|nr:ARMT1-like domain-containing protein [Candidatus Bathyarchaeia archaeon]